MPPAGRTRPTTCGIPARRSRRATSLRLRKPPANPPRRPAGRASSSRSPSREVRATSRFARSMTPEMSGPSRTTPPSPTQTRTASLMFWTHVRGLLPGRPSTPMVALRHKWTRTSTVSATQAPRAPFAPAPITARPLPIRRRAISITTASAMPATRIVTATAFRMLRTIAPTTRTPARLTRTAMALAMSVITMYV